MKTQLIKTNSIVPDKDQPRKFFNELRLKDLSKSIKRYGIKVPITVEDYGQGKFLLVDGERRYRAALQLGLDEIPATIQEPQNATDRLVEQFHLQEQHEGWNSMEKANAIDRLAKELKIGIAEIVELLNLPSTTVGTYMAVASLVEKDKFEASNVPLNWVPAIVGAKNKTKNTYERTFKETFTRSDERAFEKAVLKGIRDEQLKRRSDFSKLGDVFKTDPETIKKFLNGTLNVETAYLSSDAVGTNANRSTIYGARYIIRSIERILESKHVKISEDEKNIYRKLKKSVDTLVYSF